MDKSIEELENDFLGEPAFGSYTVTACHRARQKPLSELSAEDIRLLLGQKIGLKYILPLAMELIEKEPLREVTFFEGDMLCQLLRLDEVHWRDNEAEFEILKKIVRENYEVIMGRGDISEEDMRIIINGKAISRKMN